MKRKFRMLFVAALSSLALSGCDWIQIVDPDSGSAVPVDKYYKDYDLTLTGGRLLNELQKLSWDTHTKWISYGQLAAYYVKTSDHDSVDALSQGSSKYDLFYTNKSKTTYGSSENREHVWPCANSSGLWTHDDDAKGTAHYVDVSGYVGGGSDLYHVRPCDRYVNTSRGNARFISFTDEEHKAKEYVTYTDGGKYSVKLYGATPSGSAYEFANLCEPDDAYKGDIARLVLYVYMHYTDRSITPEGSIKSGSITYKYTDMVGTLPLTNIIGYSSEDRCKEILMAWNKLDPVSDVEKLRNVTVQKIQGNRNPFVDYPELVDQIFE